MKVTKITVNVLSLLILFGGIISDARATDSERFKYGMVRVLSDIDQNSMRFCSGDLFGLEDQNGRTILDAKYSDIEYCGHGIFLATEIQKSNKYFFGDQRHFFNRDGVELSYELPEGTLLLNIFSFGDKGDQNPDLILDKFASDTILLFVYREYDSARAPSCCRQGLCDLKGNILLPALRGTILFLEPGSAFVDPNDGKRFIVDLKTWSSTSTNLSRNPGSVPRSRLPWLKNYQVPMPFPNDRKRKVILTDNGSFDSQYWLDRRVRDGPVKQVEMFNRFLHEYDLIGMHRDRVAVLLGEPETGTVSPSLTAPDSYIYTFPCMSCVGYFDGIKINFANERVISWSFIGGNKYEQTGHEFAPITTNMVLWRPKSKNWLRTIGSFNFPPSTEPKEPAFSP
ncbi:MAG: hypothetical protein U0105_22670 [Candidatus Obscuribacterales bacterium]